MHVFATNVEVDDRLTTQGKGNQTQLLSEGDRYSQVILRTLCDLFGTQTSE